MTAQRMEAKMDDLKARLARTKTDQSCFGGVRAGAFHTMPVNPDGAAALARIEALEAQLAARDAEIADWLRGHEAYELAANSEHSDLLKLADAIEAGEYRSSPQ